MLARRRRGGDRLGDAGMSTLESTVEQYLVEQVEAAGGMAVKFIPTALAGMPDRLLFLPGGRFVAVETKAPGKKPRKLQLYRHECLRELGFTVEVIDSKQKVDELMLRETDG